MPQGTYIITLQLLDEEGLPAVPQLHVQVHRLPIDLHVYLQWVEGAESPPLPLTPQSSLLASLPPIPSPWCASLLPTLRSSAQISLCREPSLSSVHTYPPPHSLGFLKRFYFFI